MQGVKSNNYVNGEGRWKSNFTYKLGGGGGQRQKSPKIHNNRLYCLSTQGTKFTITLGRRNNLTSSSG